MKWWELPGPSRFVDEVCNEIRSGNNVIIQVPDYTPAGLRAEVLKRLDGNLSVDILEVDSAQNPSDFCFERFTKRIPAQVLRSGSSLVQYIEPGFIHWLGGFTIENWPLWRDFLSQFQHACGATSLLERTSFCAVLEGSLCGTYVSPEVRLSVHRYDDYVSRLDAMLWASLLGESSSQKSALVKDVTAAVIAHLALWDPEVTERLSACELESILEPEELLRSIGCQRSWAGLRPANERDLWSKGLCMHINGSIRLHSAYVALSGNHDEISRRVWVGLVGVLFPHIEEMRRELVARYGDQFRMPHETAHGYIRDVRDLEIGHICSQLQRIPAPNSDRQLAEHLTSMRNSLAHLECVSADVIKQVCGPPVHS